MLDKLVIKYPLKKTTYGGNEAKETIMPFCIISNQDVILSNNLKSVTTFFNCVYLGYMKCSSCIIRLVMDN